MEKHVCYDKLTKKKRREIDLKKRGSWLGVNPVTRRPEDSKVYDRKKAQGWKKDSGLALFCAHVSSLPLACACSL